MVLIEAVKRYANWKIPLAGVLMVFICSVAFLLASVAVASRCRAIELATDLCDMADAVNEGDLTVHDLGIQDDAPQIDELLQIPDAGANKNVAFFEYRPAVGGWRRARGSALYSKDSGLITAIDICVKSTLSMR